MPNATFSISEPTSHSIELSYQFQDVITPGDFVYFFTRPVDYDPNKDYAQDQCLDMVAQESDAIYSITVTNFDLCRNRIPFLKKKRKENTKMGNTGVSNTQFSDNFFLFTFL